ncbi:MAG: hypothetical protein STSR0009_05690 [Methanoregula sp.]
MGAELYGITTCRPGWDLPVGEDGTKTETNPVPWRQEKTVVADFPHAGVPGTVF